MERITLVELGNEKIRKAKVYIENKNITGADELLKEGIMLSPNNIEGLELYTICSLYFNRVENVKLLCNRLNKINLGKKYNFLNVEEIEKYKEQLEKVFQFIEENNFKKALKEIKIVMKCASKNFTYKVGDLFLINAFILINLEKFKSAKKILIEVLKEDRGNIKAKSYLEFIESKI